MDDTTIISQDFLYDKTSNVWIQPLSVIANCLLPLEYIYGDWFMWQAMSKAKHAYPNSPCSPCANEIGTGSRVEGFCYPQMLVSPSADHYVEIGQRELWQPDFDYMNEDSPYQGSIPIFTVEHTVEDPRYVKLRITEEYKTYRPNFKDSTFLNHAVELPPSSFSSDFTSLLKGRMTEELRGPVRKLRPSRAWPDHVEIDKTNVFKYPNAWPEHCMDWLVRPRATHWPPPELVQEIFECGCHIAPVGRGKRQKDPLPHLEYLQNPSETLASQEYPEKSIVVSEKPIKHSDAASVSTKNQESRNEPFAQLQSPEDHESPKESLDQLQCPEAQHVEAVDDPKDPPKSASSENHGLPKGSFLEPQDHSKDTPGPIVPENYESPKASLMEPLHDPEDPLTSLCQESDGLSKERIMDETEWRLSFSVAENMLGASVTPVQRHVQIILKILKKMYFPEVVSSYHLKNLLFWEIEKQGASFWHEDTSMRCVLHMLQRLQECLENGCLPHYIISGSNLFQDEDPAQLQVEAARVKEVRDHILTKLINMLKRVMSTTYHTQTYLLSLNWESLYQGVDDSSLTREDVKDMTCKLHEKFATMCKEYIRRTLQTKKSPQCEQSSKDLLDVSINAYKSLLGRCLCKLFLLQNSSPQVDCSIQELLNFIEEEASEICSEDEFKASVLAYFEQGKLGKNLSDVVPHSKLMELNRRYYEISERQSFAESIVGPASMPFESKGVANNIIAKLLGGGLTEADLHLEGINSETKKEIFKQLFAQLLKIHGGP